MVPWNRCVASGSLGQAWARLSRGCEPGARVLHKRTGVCSAVRLHLPHNQLNWHATPTAPLSSAGYLTVGTQLFPSTTNHASNCPVCKGTVSGQAREGV